MRLRLIERRSKKIDKLIRQNFGPHEDIWNPRHFDNLFSLTEDDSTEPLAVCTLQWTMKYWILGDLCVSVPRQGYGSEIVRQVMQLVKKPVWVDATNEASAKIFERDQRFKDTTEGPWKPEGRAFLSV
jgi:hypothetical protein